MLIARNRSLIKLNKKGLDFSRPKIFNLNSVVFMAKPCEKTNLLYGHLMSFDDWLVVVKIVSFERWRLSRFFNANFIKAETGNKIYS